MKPYFDFRARVVSFEALDAMCEHVSRVAYEYRPVKLTELYCHIQFSNLDEYGEPDPITAIYPRYSRRAAGGEKRISAIVLDVSWIINDQFNTAAQAFQRLHDCPELHFDPATGEWRTADQHLEDAVTDVIISWRKSDVQRIAAETLERELTREEMDAVIHDLDRLDFLSVEQAIEEVVEMAVEKIRDEGERTS